MIFELLPSEVQSGLILAGILGGISWLAHQAYCLKVQRKRSWRMEKALILLMKLQADLVKSGHPENKILIDQAERIEEYVSVVLEPDSDDDKDKKFF